MEQVRDYELRAFLSYVVGVLERQHIPYMVVGGFAAIFYGEPRLTLDVDIVADIKIAHIRDFAKAFPIPEYYASEVGIRDSVQRRFPFNVIHINTGAKVDVVPLPRDLFTQAAFQRRQQLAYDEQGHTAWFITAEDIVIAKLLAYRDTQSDKHLRDARGVLMMQWGKLKLDLIRRATSTAGLEKVFGQIFESAKQEMEKLE